MEEKKKKGRIREYIRQLKEQMIKKHNGTFVLYIVLRILVIAVLVLSLIEKAQQSFDEKQAAELERKMREQSFTLTDFLEQFKQIRGMGSIEQLVGMIPGVNANALKDVKVDERQLDRVEAIILSMTPTEREKPDIINASRKRRIAEGSGMKVEDVNRLLKQYDQMRQMMKKLSSMGMGGKRFGKRGMKLPF